MSPQGSRDKAGGSKLRGPTCVEEEEASGDLPPTVVAPWGRVACTGFTLATQQSPDKTHSSTHVRTGPKSACSLGFCGPVSLCSRQSLRTPSAVSLLGSSPQCVRASLKDGGRGGRATDALPSSRRGAVALDSRRCPPAPPACRVGSRGRLRGLRDLPEPRDDGNQRSRARSEHRCH